MSSSGKICTGGGWVFVQWSKGFYLPDKEKWDEQFTIRRKV
ncbi:hypothetical protein [Hoeflea sp.]